MGTIQFSAPVLLDPDGKKRSYDIIDGQQRLTTFLILQCVLDVLTGNDFNKNSKLSYILMLTEVPLKRIWMNSFLI